MPLKSPLKLPFKVQDPRWRRPPFWIRKPSGLEANWPL